jgi:hypothetical protein
MPRPGKWHGEIIGGEYRLRQYLGRSDHSAVFLAERGGSPACRLIIPQSLPQTPRSRWELGKKLNHRSRSNFVQPMPAWHSFLYVVTAAQTKIFAILPQRALTAVRQPTCLTGPGCWVPTRTVLPTATFTFEHHGYRRADQALERYGRFLDAVVQLASPIF